MRTPGGPSSERAWRASAALLLCVTLGCTGDPQSPVHAKSVLAAQKTEPVKKATPAAEKPLPPRDVPNERAAGSEKAQIDQILALMKDKERLRVIIRLQRDEFVRTPAPKYDPRRKRSSIKPELPDEDKGGLIARAQATLLEKLGPDKDRRVHLFKDAPYVALDLTRDDALALQRWVVEQKSGTPERPFQVWVEPDVVLKKQHAPCTQLEASVEEAVTYMQFDGVVPTSAKASTVILIDDRVDYRLHLLHDHVDAMQSIDLQGVATNIDTSQPASDPADYGTYKMTHGTKLALIVSKAAPNARIVALDVFGTSENTGPEYVVSALKVVLDTWAMDTTRKIAAVCISIGDETMATSSNCDCDAEPKYRGCNALDPLMLDRINALAQYQIPVVISAGSRPRYSGEVLYPACLSTGVTVGATHGGIHDANVMRSDASNWGPMVDLCAQGQDLTIRLDQWLSTPQAGSLVSGIGTGSSFAVPFVASAYSVLLDAHPEASNDLIYLALRESQVNVTSDGATAPELRVALSSKWLEDHPPSDPAPTPPEPTPGPGPH